MEVNDCYYNYIISDKFKYFYLKKQLNKAMREMHKQLKEKLKLQLEAEIFKN